MRSHYLSKCSQESLLHMVPRANCLPPTRKSTPLKANHNSATSYVGHYFSNTIINLAGPKLELSKPWHDTLNTSALISKHHLYPVSFAKRGCYTQVNRVLNYRYNNRIIYLSSSLLIVHLYKYHTLNYMIETDDTFS